MLSKSKAIIIVLSMFWCGNVMAMNCEPLQPKPIMKKEIETEVKGSAKTLFRIGEVGGDVKNKVVTEVNSIFEKYPYENRTEVKNRLIYLYCELLNSSNKISDEQKFDKLSELVSKLLEVSDNPSGPQTIMRRYQIDETKDDHPVVFDSNSRGYERRFDTDPGYKIVNVRWIPESVANASDINQNISADRKSVTFSFRLNSGPQVDR